MKKEVFLKQEFQGGNLNLPKSIVIVGEGKRGEIYRCGDIEKSYEEDVYIASDMRNYPKEYYNL